MPCAPTPRIPMQNTFDDSSDYGSDFTPDEEELLHGLLAKVATQYTTTHIGTSPTATTKPQQTQATVPASVSVPVPVGDIEGFCRNESYSNSDEGLFSPVQAPKVLGRERNPVFSWVRQIQQTQRIEGKKTSGSIVSSQISRNGDAFGTVFFSFSPFDPCFSACLVWLAKGTDIEKQQN